MKKLISAALIAAVCITCLNAKATAAPGSKNSQSLGALTNVEVNKGIVINLSQPVSSVLLANPQIADVDARSPTQLFVFGKAVGETTLYAFDQKDNEVLSTTVKVTHNISSLKSQVSSAHPDSNVSVDSTDGGIVISGDVESPKQADDVMRMAQGYTKEGEKVVNMMNIKGSSQVTLKVRIAEVQKTNLKNFGVNFQNLLTRGGFSVGMAIGRSIFDDEGNVSFDGSSNGVYVHKDAGNLDGIIDALEREGYARTLAEPNLTTTSGKKADFLAGGEIPIPVPGADNTVTIEYHQFGVVLNFTPTIMSKDKISLEVSPEVSAISQTGAITFSGFDVPSFTVRRANSTVELGSGQSIAIAGLLQSDITNQISKFPWLGDLPILGTLFSSTNFQNNETELVIVVTPYIVKPIEDNDYALPGENNVQPSDFERIFLGKLYTYRDTVQPPVGSTTAILDSGLENHHGKIGFIVE